ncbi:MAG: right-handed parallel beta-helix repeat-containing protein [Thermoplasmata archaeon]|nr:right-handed parallel beta-helix repeat-containing protein [Thermoplasmata archaeon]
MKEKLLPLLVTLLMLSSVFVGLVNQKESIVIKAEASGGGSAGEYEPIINYTYVWRKTQKLSDIVKEHPKGRAFGTPGEHEAANLIQRWMNETLGSVNVDREKINKSLKWLELPWQVFVHPLKHVMWFGSLGDLTEVRQVDAHWIRFKIKNISTGEVKEILLTYKENDTSTCFPLLAVPWTAIEKEKIGNETYYIWSAENLSITMEKPNGEGNFCAVRFTNWKDPWGWSCPIDPRIKAFILVDCFDNTYFMGPSTSKILPQFLKPGYSITGSKWERIEENLSKESCNVTVDIYSKWHYDNVVSHNIIGKLEGRDPSNVVDIICAHYDCWWNQGTIDEAAETALVLGIAKYMKKLEEEKGIKPEHTVKFIAFAGEEYGFRGSIDYIKKYVKSGEEKVRYVINPGNFGHTDSKYLDSDNRNFNVCVNFGARYIASIAINIAKALEYEKQMKLLCGDDAWTICESRDVSGEDAEPFHLMGYRKGAVIFSRNPFKGYHRDGANHTQGDVLYPNGTFCGLVNDTFMIESDIVLLTALYLCYEDVIKENLTISDYSIEKFDSGNDGKNDSARVYFYITSALPTGAKIKATLYRIVHLPNGSKIYIRVDRNCTDYFLVKDGNGTSGYVTVKTISERIPGNFTVKLELYDVNETFVDEIETESFYLNLLDVPIADFASSPEEPTDIDNVTFDTRYLSYPSAGDNSSIENYTWDFGDGCYGYGCIVNHTYADDGYYNVTLTIIDSNGKNASKTKQIYVRNVPPSVDFTISPCKIVTVGEPVIFNSTIYEPDGYIINYTWNFGDGNYSYTRNATHTYTKHGFYRVTFTATDDDNDTGTKTRWVWVFDGFVDDDYPRDDPANRRWKSIQNAINDLDDGAMIYVYNGTYNEGLVIDKSIKLYGEDSRRAIISNDRTVIDVLGNGSIEIYNFTIKDGDTGIKIVNAKAGNVISNCLMYNRDDIVIDNTSYNGITNCGLHNGNTGVKIVNSEGNIIENCSISGKNNGIYIEDSSYNNIYNCSMKLNSNSIYLYNSDNNIIGQCYIEVKNQFSIFLPSDTGMKIVQSNSNMITLCNIFNASSHGIYMASSSGNHISLCNFYENGCGGIYLVASSENFISSCNFVNNSGPGITIDSASSNNTIYYNNFIWNGVGRDSIVQAYDAGSGNRWYKATSETLLALSSGGEGNFWSDYTGNDTDNDGIGDTPYDIPGPAGSQDRYPLAQICKWDKWFGIRWGSRDDPWVRAPVPYMYIS